jgi:hypothetical protein
LIPILNTTRISGGALFTPKSISGLKLFWEASQINANDGDAVTPSDASGSATSVSGSTGQKAVYKTGIIGGTPALLFDGVDDFYSIGSFTAETIVVAAKYVGASFSTYAGLFTGQTVAGSDIYLIGDSGSTHFWADGRLGIQQFMDNAAYSAGNVVNAWHVFSVVDPSPQTAPYFIGTDRGIASRYWNGYVYGIAAYDTQLSSANRKLVEQYFGRKVGVTIS